MSGHNDLQAQSTEALLQLFRRAIDDGSFEGAEAVIEEMSRRPGIEDTCQTLILRAYMARRESQHTAAGSLANEALAVAREHGLRRLEGAALTQLATIKAKTGDFVEAIQLVDAALLLLSEVNDHRGKVTALLDKAMMLGEVGDIHESSRLATEVIDLAQQHGFVTEEIRGMMLLGIASMNAESDARSIEILLRALEMAEMQGARAVVALVQVNLGNSIGRLGDNTSAIEYYLKAAEYAQSVDDHTQLSIIYINVGVSYSDLGDHVSAIEYLDKGLELCELSPNDHVQAMTLMNIGCEYLDMDDPVTAMGFLKRAEETCVDKGLHATLTSIRANILHALLKSAQFDAAHSYVDLLLQDTIVDPFIQIDLLVYQSKLARHDGNIEVAMAQLQTALELARERGLQRSIIQVLTNIAQLHRENGDFELYFTTQDELQQLEKEFRGSERMRQISALERQRELAAQQRELDRHRTALFATLPQHVAERVLKGEQVTDTVNDACVLFLDIAGFTALSSSVPAGHVVHLLEAIFGACDEVIQQHGLTKVKTIGDSYMAVAGVVEDTPDPVGRAARAALDLMEAMNTLQVTMPPELGDTSWVESIPELKVRIGIDYGPVVAGIVGKDRLQYDVWGDTVNTASRMESSGEAGRIQVSSTLAQALDPDLFVLKERGSIDIKGKGMMTTYWLDDARSDRTV